MLPVCAGCSGPTVARQPGVESAGARDGASARQVESWQVRRGPFEQRMLLTGELVAERGARLQIPNVNIFPMVIRYLAEDGSEVKAGEVVAEFDNSQIVESLENLKSSAQEAENQLLSTRSRVANEVSEAFFTRERRQADLEKAEIAASVPLEVKALQEYERDQFELKKARLELRAANEALAATKEAGEREVRRKELELEKARRNIERTQDSLEAASLKAPTDGMFLLGIDHEGRPFRAGGSSFPGFMLASLPDLGSLMVEARLFDVDDGKIQPGDPVMATLDTFPDWRIPGVVREVGRVADAQGIDSVRRSFVVLIDLEATDPQRMRPGMSVKVELKRGEDDSLLIPRAAISYRDGEPWAHRNTGGPVKVRLGECNPTLCRLLDGLEAGTRLAPAPIGNALEDASPTATPMETAS